LASFAVVTFFGAQAATAQERFNWTGVYLGVHGGKSFNAEMDPKLADPPVGPPTQYPDGWFAGAQIAYDWHMPSRFVLGAIVDASFADMEDLQPDGNFIKQSSKIDSFGTARVRIGYAEDRVLPYLTAGLAWANLEFGESCPTGALFGFCRPAAAGPYNNKDSHLALGWTYGGGVRIAMTNHWIIGAEYLHFDMGSDTFELGFSSTGRKVTDKPIGTQFDTFRISLDYKF
jgi:outer membrane immunogenic protein